MFPNLLSRYFNINKIWKLCVKGWMTRMPLLENHQKLPISVFILLVPDQQTSLLRTSNYQISNLWFDLSKGSSPWTSSTLGTCTPQWQYRGSLCDLKEQLLFHTPILQLFQLAIIIHNLWMPYVQKQILYINFRSVTFKCHVLMSY